MSKFGILEYGIGSALPLNGVFFPNLHTGPLKFGNDMKYVLRSMPLKQRLLRRIVKTKNGCWEWQGSLKNNGYGELHFKSKKLYTHRAAWMVYKGPIPKGLCILHKCDNRSCINLDHLFLGTYQDNSQDMYKKGRENKAQGENNGLAKLNVEQVKKIRKDTRCQDIIAKSYGVAQCTIQAIKSRRTWQHVV